MAVNPTMRDRRGMRGARLRERYFPPLVGGDAASGSLQERIYQRVRQLILTGIFGFGSRLPSSRSLAKQLRVSRGSVSSAIERLGSDGWLVSRRGSGTYVSYRGPYVALSTDRSSGGMSGQPATPFALGIPPVDIFPKAIWSRLQSRRWRTISSAHLQEGGPTGLPDLQDAIAGYVAAWRGVTVAPEQIVISTCIPALIDLVVRSLELSGAEAWAESPSFPRCWQTLQNCGVKVHGISIDADGLDVAAAMRIAPLAKLVLATPNCQFPTGVALSLERRRDLLAWAAGNGSWILEDDFDWQQVGSAAPAPLVGMDPDRVIYFDTFNQVVFPALRIAYGIVPPGLLDRVIVARRGIDGSMNVPGQMILADFIAAGHLDRHLEHLQACRLERRAAFQRVLEAELGDILDPVLGASAHVVCRPRIPLTRLLSAGLRAGVAMENMADLRLIPEEPDRVMLGYFGYPPPLLREGAARLRLTLQST